MIYEPIARPIPHWIAMIGDHGYLPNTVATFERKSDALAFLKDELELAYQEDDLSDSRIAELIAETDETGSADIDVNEYDLSYISIESCDCADPDSHNDY